MLGIVLVWMYLSRVQVCHRT